MDYEKFVILWQQGVSAKEIGKKLGCSQRMALTTAYRLRKAGVPLTIRRRRIRMNVKRLIHLAKEHDRA